MRKLRSLIGIFCLCLLLINKCHAQAQYPNKTVRIIAPVAAGGGLDIIARSVAERLSKQTGQKWCRRKSCAIGNTTGTGTSGTRAAGF